MASKIIQLLAEHQAKYPPTPALRQPRPLTEKEQLARAAAEDEAEHHQRTGGAR